MNEPVVTRSAEKSTSSGDKQGFSATQVFLIVLAAIAVTVVATVLVLRAYVFPSEFKPVSLSAGEQQSLSAKLDRLRGVESGTSTTAGGIGGNLVGGADKDLELERYAETDAAREVTFTERELNGLLANNTDLAERMVIDLSDNLASVKVLVPLDPDFPVLGGKTLRLSAGVELAFADERPVVVLKGVSVMGVPIPSAWLGNRKNVDLVREFGADEGFWKSFAAGVELIEIREGRLLIRLRE